MSVQYFKISHANPFKFYEEKTTSSMHMDMDWAYSRIQSYKTRRRYNQRWQTGDETKIELVSTITPESLKVLNEDGSIVSSFAWSEKLSGAGFKVYEATVNLDSVTVNSKNHILYLYQRATLMSADFKAISEPIEVRTSWPKTKVFRYTNSEDKHGIFFHRGVTFAFRIEADIDDYKPGSEASDFIDELHNGEILNSTEYDTFKLHIGDQDGIADWALKLMNIITRMDSWTVESNADDPLAYFREAKANWDVNRVKGNPLCGASVDVMPAVNKTGLELTHDALYPGIVTGYNLDTGFFGEGDEIAVTEFDNE
jgi:hypothetical protein